MGFVVEELLQFVVEHKHKGATDTSPEVGQVALEESSDTLSSEDLLTTVNSSSILSVNFCLATFHHQSSSDGVEGIGQGLRG